MIELCISPPTVFNVNIMVVILGNNDLEHSFANYILQSIYWNILMQTIMIEIVYSYHYLTSYIL